MACYDRQSKWCMRTHHTCHLTVPFPALSPIPSPLLHTPTSHPHTSIPSTTPDSFWPTFATIAAHTFLSRMYFLCLKAVAPSMNSTLATNTHANWTLSHEPKTHSPPLPPPSLPSQQAAQTIQSSPPALSPPPPPPTAPSSPSYAHREQDLVSLILNSRARLFAHAVPRAQEIQTQRPFPYVHSRLFWGTFSHFAP